MRGATEEDVANLKAEVLTQLTPLIGGDDVSIAYIRSLPPNQFVNMMRNMASTMPLETMRTRIRDQFGTDAAATEHLYQKIEEVYGFLAESA